MTDPDGVRRRPRSCSPGPSLALAMNAAFGYAVATVARSQIAGIAVGDRRVLRRGHRPVLRLPEVLQWFPFGAAEAVTSAGGEVSIGGGAGRRDRHQLGDPQAAIVTAIWIVVAIVVTIVFTERAEIGG